MDSNLIPKVNRIRNNNDIITQDELGFIKTPNGSFWDMDGEYFNRNGYDIHGGSYNQHLEYIPGPDWLSDIGCYESEKEKYLNIDLNKDDDMFDEEEFCDDEFKGDFEDENIDLDKMNIDEKKVLEEYEKYFGKKVEKKVKKNKKGNKKKKYESWETIEEDDI